jgi:hypothetical protein
VFFVDVKLTVFSGEAGEFLRKYKSWRMGASAGFRHVLESAAAPARSTRRKGFASAGADGAGMGWPGRADRVNTLAWHEPSRALN